MNPIESGKNRWYINNSNVKNKMKRRNVTCITYYYVGE